ncbi:MAG: PP2C family protein-serine/threonine phosphatase [Myxococcota bacterium]
MAFARSHGQTDVGRVRLHNEDAFLIDDHTGLYVVADGMGGHAAGEVASAEAIDQIHAMVKNQYGVVQAYLREPSVPAASAVCRLLEAAVQAATYMVFGLAEQDPARRGMGTTISTLLVAGQHAFVAQVGDSRVYHGRKGQVVQLTEDHTLVNLQVKMGLLTPEQAKTAAHGNIITRAVGLYDYVEVDTVDVEVQPGDRFLLCSDGLHGYVSEPAEVARFLFAPGIEDGAQGLIDAANSRGGKDNISVILIETLG